MRRGSFLAGCLATAALSRPTDPKACCARYIAFTKARDLAAEVASFDQALVAMRRDGTFRRTYNAYFL